MKSTSADTVRECPQKKDVRMAEECILWRSTATELVVMAHEAEVALQFKNNRVCSVHDPLVSTSISRFGLYGHATAAVLKRLGVESCITT